MCGHGERAMTAASILAAAGHADLAVAVGGPATGPPRTAGALETGREQRDIRAVRLGLRANLGQFSLLVGVNALVGGMIGQERTVLPLIGHPGVPPARVHRRPHIHPRLRRGEGGHQLRRRHPVGSLGRKPVLVAGWLIGIPVPFLLAFGPGWAWIILANVLLGINQGLTWSTTVIMKIDLVGPPAAASPWGSTRPPDTARWRSPPSPPATSPHASGLRPDPFFLGMAFAGLGLGLSTLFVRETHGHARHEARTHVDTSAAAHAGLSTRQVFVLTSFKEKALSAASQAGLVNNLNDGLAWGIFPLFFARAGLSVGADRGPRRPLPGRVGPGTARSPAPSRTGSAASG